MNRILFLLLLFPVLSSAWFDETHLAIAKAAGYDRYYNAAGPDIAKVKAGRREEYNHFYNNPIGLMVDTAIVHRQTGLYNDSSDKEGHLYGAIIASLREYVRITKNKGFGDYHLAYCFHYIGDLSNPLHNSPYDEYNRFWHNTFDGIIEKDALSKTEKIQQMMKPVHLRSDHWEEDLSVEIARIANISVFLDKRLRDEKRPITEDEAWQQIALSASLCKAVLSMLQEMKLR